MNPLSYSIPRNRVLEDLQVLAIDNDRDSLSLYTALLEEYGATVVTALSIQEALKVFDRLIPDVLICEMQFWGESIETLTTKLSEMERRAGNHIFVIAITTWITDHFVQILDAGFEGYLLKPIDLDALISLIETSLLPSRLSFLSVLQI